MSPPLLRQVSDTHVDALVRAARAGDDAAWTQLINRFDHAQRRIARSYGLQPGDVDDVVQMTWIRLHQNIARLREPAALAGWLATTTRREAMRVLQNYVRERLSDDPRLGHDNDGDRPEARALATEERVILERAIAALPDRQRRLLALLAAQPDANYEHISATLEMPLGSIGPTRARGLGRLRRDPELCSHFGASA
jgi:RNA polymerase sigma factor (sigma-70 family)